MGPANAIAASAAEIGQLGMFLKNWPVQKLQSSPESVLECLDVWRIRTTAEAGSDEGLYLRRMDVCITQLYAGEV